MELSVSMERIILRPLILVWLGEGIVVLVLCAVLSRSDLSNSLTPGGLQPTRLLCLWGFSRQDYWSRLPCPPQGDLPNPGIELWSPTLQVDSLPSEPPGKPKSTGVVCRALLQGIFPTQGLNPHLLFPALAGGFLVFFFFYHQCHVGSSVLVLSPI